MRWRWADATRRTGLVRRSAAWFVLSPGLSSPMRHRTVAAAVYLALSQGTRVALSQLDHPGRYKAYFRTHPQRLPAVLLFDDTPTGRETLHRYVWWGPPSPGVTAPYTKVERAGRTSGVGLSAQVVHIGNDLIEQAESVAQSQAGPGRPPTALLDKVPVTTGFAAARAPGGGKLGVVCAILARHVEPAVDEALRGGSARSHG